MSYFPKASKNFWNSLGKGASVVLLIVVIMGGSAFAGFRYGRVGHVPFDTKNTSSTGDQADFNLFWQAWNIINSKFYGKADTTKRLDGAISGMVSSLGDPYTMYLPPTENELFESQLQGTFGGIGAQLIVLNSQLTIQSPLEGSPAQKAGLKAQDIITKVDGKTVANLSFNDAVTAIRGDKGSTVTLTIVRSGVGKPFDVKVVRDTITVKSVTWQALPQDTSIQYVKVNEFGQDTVSLLQQALQDAKDTGKKGVMLDLRDNPGGYLDAAVSAIGMVLPAHVTNTDAKLSNRVAVVEKSKDGAETDQSATNAPIIDQLPLVVVVNGGSASASEIFSGAMQDYKRATLVGTKTFGKGSVQDLNSLTNGGSVKVTIAKWFTPLGHGIDQKGITPDVVVDLPDGVQESTSDAQITKALEILQQK